MNSLVIFHCSGGTLASVTAAAVMTGRIPPEFPLSPESLSHVIREAGAQGRIIRRGEDPKGNPVFSLVRGSQTKLIQRLLTRGPEALGFSTERCLVIPVREKSVLWGFAVRWVRRIFPRVSSGFMVRVINSNEEGIMDAVNRARSELGMGGLW